MKLSLSCNNWNNQNLTPDRGQSHLWLGVSGGHSFLVSLLCHLTGDLDADLLYLGERRVHPAHLQVLLRHQVGQTLGREQEDGLVNVSDAGTDDPEGEAGEDVGVVSLAWLESFTKAVESREWRTRGEDCSALRVSVGRLRCTLRLRMRGE